MSRNFSCRNTELVPNNNKLSAATCIDVGRRQHFASYILYTALRNLAYIISNIDTAPRSQSHGGTEILFPTYLNLYAAILSNRTTPDAACRCVSHIRAVRARLFQANCTSVRSAGTPFMDACCHARTNTPTKKSPVFFSMCLALHLC